MEIVARAMVVALVGILAADFFITEQYGKQLWLLLGLGPALLGVARRTYPAAEQVAKSASAAQAARRAAARVLGADDGDPHATD